MKVDASALLHAHRVSEQAYLCKAANLKRMQAIVDAEARRIKELDAQCEARERKANFTTGRVDVFV